MKNRARDSMVLIFILAFAVPSVVYAVSYPILEEHRQVKEKAIMTVGATVYLFHSGTRDVKKAIRINDILSVYRESPSCEMQEVGKIKVLSFAGENYIKGVIVEGEIREDDIAKKGTVSFLVILSEDKCK